MSKISCIAAIKHELSCGFANVGGGVLNRRLQQKARRKEYFSLRFDFEHLDQRDFQQGHSVVNYTVSEDFTRITEFQYLTGQKDCDGTTIVREYPFAYSGATGEIPYYAILNADNEALYEKYRALTAGLSDFYLLGRLAEYKYYNMDAMARRALDLAERIMEKKR